MKYSYILLTLLFIHCSLFLAQAQVAINTDNSNPDASAMLDVKSTDKGVLIPRMTTSQRTMINSPATGLLVFDTNTASFWFYNGTAWQDLSAAPNQIADADNDTKIQVEESTDEDVIRMDIGGNEFLVINDNSIQVDDPNQGLLIGFRKGNLQAFHGSTYIGYKSGDVDSLGQFNVGLGTFALNFNGDGIQNTALGRESMVVNSNGNDNTAAGFVSLRQNSTGSNNSAFGSQALVLNQTGSNNTAHGYQALVDNTTGSDNTAIGAKADVSSDNLTNATAIGANAIVSQDSSLILGNASKVGIGTSIPDADLHVVGNIKMVDGNQAAGNILISDTSGLSTWTNPNDGLPVPDTAALIPIRYHGSYIYVHPTDNAMDTDWTGAQDSCSNLVAFGFDDWYLPSKLELDAMYKQSYLLTGLSQTTSAKYWSNTAQDISNAFTQRLDYGGPDPDAKTDTAGHSCRCVRRN